MMPRTQSVYSLLNCEIEPKLQRVEVFSEFQIPSFQIVGLPSAEVSESKERIRGAFASAGFSFPKRRVVLNLSPANVRKQGTGCDLALAIRIWLESEESHALMPYSCLFAWGELGLSGDVRSPGHTLRALKAAISSKAEIALFSAEAHADLDIAMFYLAPSLSSEEKSTFQKLKVACIPSLGHLKNIEENLRPVNTRPLSSRQRVNLIPSSVSSRPVPNQLPRYDQRAAAIALTGGMHTLFVGSKGVGKTTLSDTIVHLHRSLGEPQPLETFWVRELRDPFLLARQQTVDSSIRRIDVNVRPQALTGGVYRDEIVPGEFSLASGGLLIADEFAEWSRDSREVLRSPLEIGELTLSRSRTQVTLPARFQMIATANECPCGRPREIRAGIPASDRCRCTLIERNQYLNRISGPLLDRFGVVARLLPKQPLVRLELETLSDTIYEARERLRKSWGTLPSRLDGPTLDSIFKTDSSRSSDPDAHSALSYRKSHHLMRIALVLAALDQIEFPLPVHFSDAKSFLATLDDA